jgi:hypothetical protein
VPRPKGGTGTDKTPFIYLIGIALYFLAKAIAPIGPTQSGFRGERGPSAVQDLPSPGTTAPFSMSFLNRDLDARLTRWSSEESSYGATGEVVNRGTKTYHFIMIKVEFCDRTGRVVGTLTTDASREEYVPPGRSKSFAVRGNGKLDFATARASVVYSAEVK